MQYLVSITQIGEYLTDEGIKDKFSEDKFFFLLEKQEESEQEAISLLRPMLVAKSLSEMEAESLNEEVEENQSKNSEINESNKRLHEEI